MWRTPPLAGFPNAYHPAAGVLSSRVRPMRSIIIFLATGAYTGYAPVASGTAGAALGMVVVAESLILLTGKFDISLQGTFGLAPLLGAWLIAPKAKSQTK